MASLPDMRSSLPAIEAPIPPGAKCTLDDKHFIVGILADHGSVQECADRLASERGVQLTIRTIRWYRDRYAADIADGRQRLEAQIGRIPMSSRYWRMKARQDLYDKAIKTPETYPTARGLLMDAAREIGHLDEKEAEASRRNLPPMYAQIINQIIQLPPEALDEFSRTGEIPRTGAQAVPTLPEEPVTLDAETVESGISGESDKAATPDDDKPSEPGDITSVR